MWCAAAGGRIHQVSVAQESLESSEDAGPLADVCVVSVWKDGAAKISGRLPFFSVGAGSENI